MDLNTISVIGGILSPIIVAVIAARNEYMAKNNKKLQELEKENKKLEDEKLKDTLNKISANVASVSESVSSVESNLKELSDKGEMQDNAIRTISKMMRINGQYIHELAQLVTVLSEGMRDQHLDGNITRAINNYRKFESKAFSTLLSGDVDYTEDP